MKPSPKNVAMRYATWGAAKSPLPPGGGVWLSRVGGLTPTRQSGGAAPEKKGFWAFVWPFLDLFLIGSTNEYGVVNFRKPLEGANKPRLQRVMERIEKIRKFKYEGLLWTYWKSAEKYAIKTRGRWNLIHTDDFRPLILKEIHDAHNYIGELERDFIGPDKTMGPRGGPLIMSTSFMEVFIPANKGHVFGKPDNPPPSGDESDGEIPRRKLRSPRVLRDEDEDEGG